MNRYLKLTAAAAAVAVVAGLNGCSALNVGEEEFACSGMPGSVYCHSARDVYDKTNDGVVPTPVGKKEGAYNPDCDDCIRAEDVNPALAVEEDEQSQYALTKDGKRLKIVGGRVSKQADGSNYVVMDSGDEIINNYVTPALPDRPVPIRTPAQVMRIWVAPYVDTSGDLIAPGFVYTEVESRRWIYPEYENDTGAKRFNPLKAAGGSGIGSGRLLQQGHRYNTPNSYSKPAITNRGVQDRDGYNSLLKFRAESAKDTQEMTHK